QAGGGAGLRGKEARAGDGGDGGVRQAAAVAEEEGRRGESRGPVGDERKERETSKRGEGARHALTVFRPILTLRYRSSWGGLLLGEPQCDELPDRPRRFWLRDRVVTVVEGDQPPAPAGVEAHDLAGKVVPEDQQP